MQYITDKQASKRWGISDRRIRMLCAEGRIKGIVKEGRSYLIPADTLKLIDRRHFRRKYISDKYAELFKSIDEMKVEFNRRRPLTSGGLKRLQDEFLIEFTYSSI